VKVAARRAVGRPQMEAGAANGSGRAAHRAYGTEVGRHPGRVDDEDRRVSSF
jgi:hypothetical protein